MLEFFQFHQELAHQPCGTELSYNKRDLREPEEVLREEVRVGRTAPQAGPREAWGQPAPGPRARRAGQGAGQPRPSPRRTEAMLRVLASQTTEPQGCPDTRTVGRRFRRAGTRVLTADPG